MYFKIFQETIPKKVLTLKGTISFSWNIDQSVLKAVGKKYQTNQKFGKINKRLKVTIFFCKEIFLNIQF